MDDKVDFDTFILENFEFLSTEASEDSNSFQAELHMHYAMLKTRLFHRWGKIEDIEEAIEKGKHAVAMMQEVDEIFTVGLNNLGIMLISRYERTRKIEDLEEAIQVARQAVEATPEDHPNLAAMLGNLGPRLGCRYVHMGKREDLEEAIQIARQAVKLTPNNDPDLAGRLHNLGSQLGSRYERMGKRDDLEEAIQVARQAVELTPDDHLDLAAMLSNLGNNLSSRHKRTGKMEDLDEAIELARQSIKITPNNHPDLARMLGDLGRKLERQHERTGKSLDEAIQVAQQAVELTPDEHPDLAGRLNNLGNKLGSRYKQTGKMKDLEKAIQVAREAVKVTPDNHLNLAAMLSNLGNKLQRQHERTGVMEDLNEAIRVARRAVELTPDDYPDLTAMLSNLGTKLEIRYQRTGKMEDLDEAIRVTQQAVKITPNDHPDLTGRLSNKFQSQHDRTGKNLDEAIRVARQAIKLTPDDHPDFARGLDNLGVKLARQYEHTGNKKNIDEAIQVSHQAVKLTPSTHPEIAGRLNGLGNALSVRYERERKIEDLEEAIQVARQAVEVTPNDHSGLAMRLYNLGSNLTSRYLQTEKTEDFKEAIHVAQHAWRCENATPFVRIRACILALNLLQSHGHFERAYILSREAIDLLPYVHNRYLDHQDQQYVVSHFSGLATTACSLALQIGIGPETALKVLEQGRGVILSLLMNKRSNTSKLKAAYPELCLRYESLCLEVNKPVKNITDDSTGKTDSMGRTEAIAKLEKCVRSIQHLPGFSHFHKGLTTKQIHSCAMEGSIVVVNVTGLRSDAIIVTADAFMVLPLPGLSADQARNWINQDLTTTSRSDRGRKNKAYLQFLSWVWRGCVEPVLNKLHYYLQPSADNLPRVWWIGTGLASSFPFHAAGDISAGSTESACYRVISSYTPTIKALQYAQERTRLPTATPSGHDPWKVVIVTMPETPHLNPLPGTGAERSKVIAALGPSVSIETLEHPDTASAMAQLQECHIAHFACHGVSDLVDPSSSGLILQTAGTATEESRQDILSVLEVSQAHLLRAEIAYLSACSTAQNQAIKLSDEVIHVVSGFQVAGFRHVVGCLWPSKDEVCVEIAESFYSALGYGGVARYEDRDIALALQRAVVKFREGEKYCKQPLLWAQYVHFGA